MKSHHESSDSEKSLEQSAEQAQDGILHEFWDFLRYNKKWWLTPIILGLLVVGTLVLLSAATPFIYNLF